MPLYKYKGIDKEGKSISGYQTAANPQDLENRLKTIHLYLVSHKEMARSRFDVVNSISIKEKIITCIHLESLERAGVPLLDAIADLRDSADTLAMKNLMSDVYESLVGGEMLSAAFAKHPHVFDTMFVGLVKAGEKTGKLSDIFMHLANHLKWTQLLRSKIKKATYYPIFLLMIIMGVITQMMMFVIPKLTDFLLNQGFTLPWYTHLLIGMSNGFVNYWYIILPSPLIIFFTIYIGNRVSTKFAYKFDQFVLKIPVIGNTVLKIEISRFCRFFSICYKSGIGILECLDISADVVNNLVIKKNIKESRDRVVNGISLTKSLEATGRFPTLVCRMFKVGEESGQLDNSLQNVNFFYDKEVEDAVNAMIGLIQPALTLILGFMIGWIVIAVFGPLYGSFAKMKF